MSPKHIWEGEDAKTFANLDLQRGWPVVSGPYRLVRSEPQQRIWDLRRDWWAAETGFRRLPRVERLIYLPYIDEDKRVQLLISNQMDTCLDLRPSNIKTILDQNPDVSTWTGREPPYGYLDWWPIALGFNNLEAPFADAEIRWAINHAINRQQLVEVGWQGAGTYSLLPFPDFPPLRRFMDQIGDLLARYPVGTHDPAKTAEIMQRRGWDLEKGIWTKEGTPFKITIDLHPNLHDIVPVLVEQLRRAGFDAGFQNDFRLLHPHDRGRRPGPFLIGNAGSVRDPYFTLRLYHSRYVQPTGYRRYLLLALAKRPLRPNYRPHGWHVPRRSATARTLSPSYGNLAARAALHPATPVVPQNPPQRNLLAELAHRRDALYQQRLLGAHMAAGPPRTRTCAIDRKLLMPLTKNFYLVFTFNHPVHS